MIMARMRKKTRKKVIDRTFLNSKQLKLTDEKEKEESSNERDQ